MSERDFRLLSKQDWSSQLAKSTPNTDDLNTGAFLRIADSLEKIASSKESLEAEIQALKEKMEWQRDYIRRKDEIIAKLKRSGAGYKGRMNYLETKLNKIKEISTRKYANVFIVQALKEELE